MLVFTDYIQFCTVYNSTCIFLCLQTACFGLFCVFIHFFFGCFSFFFFNIVGIYCGRPRKNFIEPWNKFLYCALDNNLFESFSSICLEITNKHFKHEFVGFFGRFRRYVLKWITADCTCSNWPLLTLTKRLFLICLTESKVSHWKVFYNPAKHPTQSDQVWQEKQSETTSVFLLITKVWLRPLVVWDSAWSLGLWHELNIWRQKLKEEKTFLSNHIKQNW